MKPGITLEVQSGSRIEDVCARAQDIADRLESSVGFTFNSVRCVALPMGSAEKLAEMQNEAQRSEFVVYSNSAKIEMELRDGR